MRPRNRTAGVLLAVVLLASTPGTASAAPGGPAGTDARREPGTPKTVTLVTGDKVIVIDADRATVEPGPGRKGT